MSNTGVEPGRVYTTPEVTLGTQLPTTGPGFRKEHVFCIVAASQNLVDGTIVTIDGSNVATVAAVGGGAGNIVNRVGVCTTSVTASASSYIWVQVFGPVSVIATTSTLPNVALTIGATAGRVDDAISSLSSHIVGLHLTATSNTSGALAAAFLNYPRYDTTGGVIA